MIDDTPISAADPKKEGAMYRCLVRVTVCAAAFALSLSIAGTALATGKGQATRGAKGGPGVTEPQLKGTDAKNDPAAAPEAPPDKGGKKTRAQLCHLHVDNRTSLYVKIFVDGDYVGTVYPWGDSYGTYAGGGREVYGRADFTDGSWSYWGPSTISCKGPYTWTLWP
jgi:hypothetical protein